MTWLARHRGDEIGRNLRGIGKRLVVPFRQSRNDVERLLRGHGEFGVLGAEMARDRGGMRRLVEARNVEADRERPHRPGIGGLHQRHHRRGIDAARQKRADRHVGDHAPPHRVREQGLQFVGQFAIAAAVRIGEPCVRDLRAHPNSARFAARRPRAT